MRDNVYHVGRERTGSCWRGTVDPSLRPLLDHIAAELAQEYIRLMEAAAGAEAAASLSVADA
jgi:hypothetical protein